MCIDPPSYFGGEPKVFWLYLAAKLLKGEKEALNYFQYEGAELKITNAESDVTIDGPIAAIVEISEVS